MLAISECWNFLPSYRERKLCVWKHLFAGSWNGNIYLSKYSRTESISLKQRVKHCIEPSNRFQTMYVHIKWNLTASWLIISSLSLNLSCRQLIRCVSSDLDSHFLDCSSNSLSLYQRKCRPEKTSSYQVQEIPGLYSALNSKTKIQGHSQAFPIK